MHNAQLHDVELVVKAAGDHGQARARLLVERPESEIVAIQIVQQGANAAGKKLMRGMVASCQEVVIDSPQSPDESVEDVCGRRHDVFLKPEVPGFVGEGYAALVNGPLKAGEGLAGGIEITRVAGFFVGANQKRDSLPLRQGRVPRGFERIAILPVEVMVPDGQAVRIRFKVRGQPVGNQEKFLAAFWIGSAAPEVVVAQSKLRDGDGIVLQADVAVIVELRNAGWIVSAAVVSFLREEHIVLAEFAGSGVRIFGGSFVPEREMAFAAEDVGAKDTPVVGEAGHDSDHITVLAELLNPTARARASTTKGTKVHEGKRKNTPVVGEARHDSDHITVLAELLNPTARARASTTKGTKVHEGKRKNTPVVGEAGHDSDHITVLAELLNPTARARASTTKGTKVHEGKRKNTPVVGEARHDSDHITVLAELLNPTARARASTTKGTKVHEGKRKNTPVVGE